LIGVKERATEGWSERGRSLRAVGVGGRGFEEDEREPMLVEGFGDGGCERGLGDDGGEGAGGGGAIGEDAEACGGVDHARLDAPVPALVGDEA
jgi:hypothetical protein